MKEAVNSTVAERISVLMVSFNHAPYIERAIASVFAQTRAAHELVIFDDGSIDGTPDICRRISSRFPGKVRVCSHEGGRNRGIGVSYRCGVQQCRGDIIAFLEADDEWRPGNLEKKASVLSADPAVGVVYSDVAPEVFPGSPGPGEFYCRRMRAVPAGRAFDAFPRVLWHNPVPTFSCAVVRAGLLKGLCFDRPRRDELWTDWFVWSQLASMTRFYFIPEKLVTWRHHPASAYGMRRGRLSLKAGEMRQRLFLLRQALLRGKTLTLRRRLLLPAQAAVGMLGACGQYLAYKSGRGCRDG